MSRKNALQFPEFSKYEVSKLLMFQENFESFDWTLRDMSVHKTGGTPDNTSRVFSFCENYSAPGISVKAVADKPGKRWLRGGEQFAEFLGSNRKKRGFSNSWSLIVGGRVGLKLFWSRYTSGFCTLSPARFFSFQASRG